MTSQAVNLSENQILKDIEGVIRDLNIHGPSFPYDSVCRFLRQCLNVASRDVRFCRLRMEEKVLWRLTDCWKPAPEGFDGTSRAPNRIAYTPEDILQPLAVVAGLGTCPQIYSMQVHPKGFLPSLMQERAKRKVIQDYMLDAKLPDFQFTTVSNKMGDVSPERGNADASERQTRDRLTSAMIQKLVEAELEVFSSSEIPSTISASRVRQSLYLAVVAILFDSLLIRNTLQSPLPSLPQHASLPRTYSPASA